MKRLPVLVLSVSVLFVDSALAQNWSFDARKIGMGSPTVARTWPAG